MKMDKSCETCRHGLGGGYENCAMNLERECAEGGFEAWEPREPDKRIVTYWDEVNEWKWPYPPNS